MSSLFIKFKNFTFYQLQVKVQSKNIFKAIRYCLNDFNAIYEVYYHLINRKWLSQNRNLQNITVILTENNLLPQWV